MKIGILTLPFNLNYGGFLQAYALMTILKRLGHSPVMIMRRHEKRTVTKTFLCKYAIKGIIKTIVRCKKHPFKYNVENDYIRRGRLMLEFINNHMIPQSPFIYTTDELRNYCADRFDAYIVGSDQVWRPDYVPGVIYNLFLDFTKGWKVKRLAYAASFGTYSPKYDTEQKQTCGKLVENFDAVSLRELSGINVFNEFNWKYDDLKVVLDPTMLLDKRDYLSVLPEEKTQFSHKILSYILDDNEDIEALCIKASNHIKKQVFSFDWDREIKPPIEEWLMAFRDCDFVITDSYHGTVFSIIFNKPFLAVVNNGRGADRFYTLLNTFGLSNRMVNADNYGIESILKDNIDWQKVNQILTTKKEESLNFLRTNLHEPCIHHTGA